MGGGTNFCTNIYCLLTFFQGEKNLLAKDIVDNVYCCTLRTKLSPISEFLRNRCKRLLVLLISDSSCKGI